MTSNSFPAQVEITADASGAYQAGKKGNVVVIVDIIDMSTTLDSALEAGATAVFGASPSRSKAPVPVNPAYIGEIAGKVAITNNCSIVIVSEPRWGSEEDLVQNAALVIQGINKTRAKIAKIIPNLGASTPFICDCNNKVVIAVTDTGGTAFDAAYNAGGKVLTGTIARTYKSKGTQPLANTVAKTLKLASLYQKNISIVAASANSLEDVLAAQYLGMRLIEEIRR